MEQREIAWVAGIIEGEGTFYISPRGFGRIKVAMTDLDVIERLHEWTGYGHVTGPHLHGANKPSWAWTVSTIDECIALGEAVQPWMCLRRGLALESLLAVERTRKARQLIRRAAPGYRDRRKSPEVT